MKEKNSYQIMISILNNYNPNKEEKNKINPFFFVRYLSNDARAIHIGNVFNRFYKEIPLSIQYDIAKQLLNKKIKFIQFPKKEKNTNKTISNISKYYKLNLSKAQEYYNIMNEEERKRFELLYEGA
jgi:hypothetical protein